MPISINNTRRNKTKPKPKNILRNSKLVSKKINMLDIGFEDAQKLISFASKRRHKNKKFLGIEWAKSNLNTRYNNLKLIFGNAISKLRRMEQGSVKVVTADFLFTEFKINGKESSDVSLRKNILVEKKFDVERLALMKEVRRVLKSNGRFFVTEYSVNSQLTIDLLKKAGFEVYSRPMKPSEMHSTLFLKEISEAIQKNPNNQYSLWPIKIVARKVAKV